MQGVSSGLPPRPQQQQQQSAKAREDAFAMLWEEVRMGELDWAGKGFYIMFVCEDGEWDENV